jgi:hypothetical protein
MGQLESESESGRYTRRAAGSDPRLHQRPPAVRLCEPSTPTTIPVQFVEPTIAAQPGAGYEDLVRVLDHRPI